MCIRDRYDTAFVQIADTFVHAYLSNQHPRPSAYIEKYPAYASDLLAFFDSFLEQAWMLESLSTVAPAALPPASPTPRSAQHQRPAAEHHIHDAPGGYANAEDVDGSVEGDSHPSMLSLVAEHQALYHPDVSAPRQPARAASSISALAAERGIPVRRLAANLELSDALVHWLDATALDPNDRNSVPSELVERLSQQLNLSHADVETTLRASHPEAVKHLETLGHDHLLNHMTFRTALSHDDTLPRKHREHWDSAG